MAMSMVMFVWFSSFFLVALLLAFLVYQVSIYTFQVYLLQLMNSQGTDRQAAVDSRSTLVYVCDFGFQSNVVLTNFWKYLLLRFWGK